MGYCCTLLGNGGLDPVFFVFDVAPQHSMRGVTISGDILVKKCCPRTKRLPKIKILSHPEFISGSTFWVVVVAFYNDTSGRY